MLFTLVFLDIFYLQQFVNRDHEAKMRHPIQIELPKASHLRLNPYFKKLIRNIHGDELFQLKILHQISLLSLLLSCLSLHFEEIKFPTIRGRFHTLDLFQTKHIHKNIYEKVIFSFFSQNLEVKNR
jgi:hypothetical protein